MKKYLILGIILFSATIFVAAKDDAFVTALQGCSRYSESGQVNTEGMSVKFKNQILGWEGDKCIYKETVNYAGIDSCTTCRLTKRQINELVNVMRAYSTVQKYSTEKLDTSNLSNVQDNPVVNAWSKYLQDSSVCTIEMKE